MKKILIDSEQKKVNKEAKDVIIKNEIDEPDASLADYDNSDPRYDDIDAQFRVALAKKNS